MQELWKAVTLFIICGAGAAYVILLKRSRINNHKNSNINHRYIRERYETQPTVPLASDKEEIEQEKEIYRQKCKESFRKLEDVKANKVYASLIEILIPRIQKLMGYMKYNLPVGADSKLLEILRYLIGVNFDNELYNQCFLLNNQGILEYTRMKPNRSMENIDEKLDLNELKLLLERNEKEEKNLRGYYERKQMCLAIGLPLKNLKRLSEAERIDKLAIEKEILNLEQIFLKYGFEFKFYEDFPKDSLEVNRFMRGDEWSLDYPALYLNGALYCDYVGRRKGE